MLEARLSKSNNHVKHLGCSGIVKDDLRPDMISTKQCYENCFISRERYEPRRTSYSPSHSHVIFA